MVASERVNTNFQGEAVAPDGAVWTVDYYFGTLDRFTAAGKHEQFPISQFYPSGIALGAGGDLWINENGGAARLARATQRGAITFFNLPPLQFAEGGLVAGPDNSVWFTEQMAIGRITPRGTVTQFASNGCSTASNGIAVGSDGRLWYGGACPGNPNVVFALAPATGHQVSYPISPSVRLAAAGIVAGPDGALWFTSAQNGGHLGRITTAGSITAYKVLPGQFPAFSASAQNIAVGPDRKDLVYPGPGNSVGPGQHRPPLARCGPPRSAADIRPDVQPSNRTRRTHVDDRGESDLHLPRPLASPSSNRVCARRSRARLPRDRLTGPFRVLRDRIDSARRGCRSAVLRASR